VDFETTIRTKLCSDMNIRLKLFTGGDRNPVVVDDLAANVVLPDVIF